LFTILDQLDDLIGPFRNVKIETFQGFNLDFFKFFIYLFLEAV